MARLVWTEPALQDLEAIADYIALDKPSAAARFIRRVFAKVEFSGNSLRSDLCRLSSPTYRIASS